MRPERIVKLMNYLSDKEPLIYLFLLNSDFIEDDGRILGNSPAGVTFKNKRVIFYYSEKEMSKLSINELFFLIIHEAFHIFKKHIDRHEELYEINHMLANISEDAVINHEIRNYNFSYDLKAEMPKGGILPNREFLNQFIDLKEHAIETYRIFNWYYEKHKNNKPNSWNIPNKIKNKNTGQEGRPFDYFSDNDGENCYRVRDSETGGERKEKEKDCVIIVEPSKNSKEIEPFQNSEYEYSFDKHIKIEEDKSKDDFKKVKEEIERNTFVDSIVEQASQIEKSIKNQNPGKEQGNLSRVIKEINKPKVNWRKELRKHMHSFISTNSYIKSKVKSSVNYPWDPKSNYGILGKHDINIINKLNSYIIFAIDTSGSCFFSEEEVQNFFSELDFASKELGFSRTGKIFTIQWDYYVNEGLKEYKRGDWKHFNLKGGGGTRPSCVFNYLSEAVKEVGGKFLFSSENGERFITPDKKTLPLIVFLTDGYFYPIYEEDLGIYKNSKKNILWMTRNIKNIIPKENYIHYS